MTAAVTSGVLRVVFNRDEQPARPAALPPRRGVASGVAALLPIDPAGGGTWLAVNEFGVVLALLNRTPRHAAPPRRAAPPVSRGTIIPTLLHHRTIAAVLHDAGRLDPRRHEPFRLVALTHDAWGQCVTHRGQLRCWTGPWDGRVLLWASSGLGDHRVRGVRRRLLRDTTRVQAWSPPVQDDFHRHHWPHAPHLSVLMERGVARTVSVSTVTVGGDAAALLHQARDRATATQATLPRRRPGDG